MKLDLIVEVRNSAKVKEEGYKHKTTQYYNKRVKNKKFQAGDLVLCRA